MKRIKDLRAGGSTHAEIQRLRRSEKLLTWGVYVPHGMTAQDEYLAKCHAVLERLHPSAALAGPSAAAFYEIPLSGGMPSKVYVRNILRGRYAGDVEVLPAGPAIERRGVSISTPEATALDCARLLGSRDALVVADGALAGSLCSREGLQRAADSMAGRHGASRMRWVAAHADPLAESPGETWTRLLATELGFDLTSQVHVRDEQREARLDFLASGTKVALEFDGAIKYKRQGAIKVIQQLLRDGDLQAMGYTLLHFVWLQLSNPKQFDVRLRHAGVLPVRRPHFLAW